MFMMVAVVDVCHRPKVCPKKHKTKHTCCQCGALTLRANQITTTYKSSLFLANSNKSTLLEGTQFKYMPYWFAFIIYKIWVCVFTLINEYDLEGKIRFFFPLYLRTALHESVNLAYIQHLTLLKRIKKNAHPYPDVLSRSYVGLMFVAVFDVGGGGVGLMVSVFSGNTLQYI